MRQRKAEFENQKKMHMGYRKRKTAHGIKKEKETEKKSIWGKKRKSERGRLHMRGVEGATITHCSTLQHTATHCNAL